MRTTMVKLAALGGLLAILLGGAALGDPPADPKKPAEEKKPPQLEELIAQALRDNPDIRVADAKMREAEAELSRVRLQVIQKVVAHQHNVETLGGAVKMAEANYTAAQAKLKFADAEQKRIMQLNRAGALPGDLDAAQANVEQARANVENAKAALQSAKADLAKAQAELPYLLGKANKGDKEVGKINWLDELYDLRDRGPSSTARGLYALQIAQAQAAWKKADLPQGALPEKIRKALDAPISVAAEDQPLTDVLKAIESQAGVPFFDNLPRDLRSRPVRARVGNVSLGAVCQLLGDLTGVQFAVRDYGILVSDKLPPGVMPLHDFWKEASKPRRWSVEGKVISAGVDGEVEISIGTDDGLVNDVTLEVYRALPDKSAKFLGAIRVVKVGKGTSAGTFVGKPAAAAEVGDRVSGSFVVE